MTGTRLTKVASEFNVAVGTITEFLKKKGFDVNTDPNAKIDQEQYELVRKEFSSDSQVKKDAELLSIKNKERKEAERKAAKAEAQKKAEEQKKQKQEFKIVGKIDLDQQNKPKNQDNQNTQQVAGKNDNTTPATTNPTPKQEQEKTQIQNQNPNISNKQNGDSEIKVIGKIDLDTINQKTRPAKKTRSQIKEERRERDKQYKATIQQQQQKNNTTSQQQGQQQTQLPQNTQNTTTTTEQNEDNFIEIKRPVLSGPTVVGKIELQEENKDRGRDRTTKRKRKRIAIDIQKEANNNQNNNNRGKDSTGNKENNKNNKKQQKNNNGNNNGDKKNGKNKQERFKKPEITDEDTSKTVKETLKKLEANKHKSLTSKHNRDKRDKIGQKIQEEKVRQEHESHVLKVTEFISANDLASLMNVEVTEIINTCFDMGIAVSINQRLDAELISMLAEEYGFEIKFINADEEEDEEQDNIEDMQPRAPIVTVMGHVDHGKTSLLDYIRKTNVIAGEAGGITQHIGAYNVEVGKGQRITFLDTPGHEAFTAMRARGAKITDIAVIVIAADDSIMPQTEEAISHAQAAGVPIIFAINKIDKPGANPEKIKEELANKNLLVEDWGGKYGSIDISAKKGLNVDKLLERILLEAEMLELKANYNKPATGSIIEASLDKGRGYVATVLVDNGTLKVGDVIWAGCYSGKIRAMFNERNKKITEVHPAEPALILGLDGAPAAGDKFKIMPDERSAREKATQRQQIDREISVRTHKGLTLEDIGRRIAIGEFKELKLVIKGDVQGSIEALQDSLIKLSTEKIEVQVIHKGVGQISETDVLLASASKAMIIGFQVRPSLNAKKLAEKEQIDIRLYSIIYDAINDIKSAMEGMLSPEIKEEIVGTAEITQIFKISKVGNIAGCIVKDGKIVRTNKCRIIRDGIVVYTGELGSLKRFKDDVKEVTKGFECGLNINNYNDIKIGDMVESFVEKEVRTTL